MSKRCDMTVLAIGLERIGNIDLTVKPCVTFLAAKLQSDCTSFNIEHGMGERECSTSSKK
jgi:hypothetical protein